MFDQLFFVFFFPLPFHHVYANGCTGTDFLSEAASVFPLFSLKSQTFNLNVPVCSRVSMGQRSTGWRGVMQAGREEFDQHNRLILIPVSFRQDTTGLLYADSPPFFFQCNAVKGSCEFVFSTLDQPDPDSDFQR